MATAQQSWLQLRFCMPVLCLPSKMVFLAPLQFVCIWWSFKKRSDCCCHQGSWSSHRSVVILSTELHCIRVFVNELGMRILGQKLWLQLEKQEMSALTAGRWWICIVYERMIVISISRLNTILYRILTHALVHAEYHTFHNAICKRKSQLAIPKRSSKLLQNLLCSVMQLIPASLSSSFWAMASTCTCTVCHCSIHTQQP